MSVNLKKKYGQNFLVDQNILSKISNLIHSDNLKVLEIGPGDGRLTDKIISKRPSLLTLIEIDKDLIKNLNEKYLYNKRIKLVNEDILNYEIKKGYELVISNLPYNISSQILVKLSIMDIIPDTLILMFQKEFADRLISEKLNNLNCLIKCFYNIKKKFNVSKNSFYPCPKIDSTVLTFNKKKTTLINYSDLKLYSEFKSMIFVNKRKKISTILKKNNIKFINNEIHQKRVDQLTLENFVILFKSLKPELINKFC